MPSWPSVSAEPSSMRLHAQHKRDGKTNLSQGGPAESLRVKVEHMHTACQSTVCICGCLTDTHELSPRSERVDPAESWLSASFGPSANIGSENTDTGQKLLKPKSVL